MKVKSVALTFVLGLASAPLVVLAQAEGPITETNQTVFVQQNTTFWHMVMINTLAQVPGVDSETTTQFEPSPSDLLGNQQPMPDQQPDGAAVDPAAPGANPAAGANQPSAQGFPMPGFASPCCPPPVCWVPMMAPAPCPVWHCPPPCCMRCCPPPCWCY